jgi:rod shape-determining protein MreC
MESFFTRFKNPLVLIAIVLLQVIALAVQLPARTAAVSSGSQPDGAKVTLLRRWTGALVTPVEKLLHGTSEHVRGAWADYVYLRHTREENAALKAQVARLREEQASFAEDAAQGRRLQQLLAFKEQYITSTVAAQVIGTSGSDRSRMLTLDKGSADGLRPEQAVMTPDGAVGKLRDVFPHSAQLLLLNDASSGAGVILVGSRIRAILRGTATGEMEIDNLTADSRIKVGEKVVTSGGDMVFPRGIPVGEIVSIAPDPRHQPYTTIKVRPWANLWRLEEVLAITGTSDALPPAAAADAATAEATAEANAAAQAEANKRAADLVAEKLPSLHDDEPAEGADGAASAAELAQKTASQAVPKPKPAVRADKYSSGETPPAAELVPGVKAPAVAAPPPEQ